MTKRLFAVLGLALGTLAVGAPASGAQTSCGGYNQPSCPTTTTAPTTTTSTTAPTTTTTAPAPAVREAESSTTVAEPGQPVTVSTGGNAGLAPGTSTTAGIARGAAGTAPSPLASAQVEDDGSVSVTIEIPEGTPTGVYYLYIIGETPSGQTRVFIVPIVVNATATGASVEGDQVDRSGGGSSSDQDPSSGGATSADGASTPTAAPRALVVVQEANSLTPEAEADVVAAAVDGADLELDGTQLIVEGRPVAAGPISADDGIDPLVAAAALAVAGSGVVLLRRRSSTIAAKG